MAFIKNNIRFCLDDTCLRVSGNILPFIVELSHHPNPETLPPSPTWPYLIRVTSSTKATRSGGARRVYGLKKPFTIRNDFVDSTGRPYGQIPWRLGMWDLVPK